MTARMLHPFQVPCWPCQGQHKKPRVLGGVKMDDFTALLTRWRIPMVVPPAGNRAPALVETEQATMITRACQLVAGSGQTLDEMRTALAKQEPHQQRQQLQRQQLQHHQ